MNKANVNAQNAILYFFIQTHIYIRYFFLFKDTPLHLAADNDYYEAAKILLEHGAKVNIKNHNEVFFNFLKLLFWLQMEYLQQIQLKLSVNMMEKNFTIKI